MAQQILLRRGTAAQWTTNGTVVLAAGEPGVETDTGKFKIGDGVTSWASLPYAVGDIPTTTNDLINNSGFITADDIPVIPTDLSDLTDTNFIIPRNLDSLADVADNAAFTGAILVNDGTSWNGADSLNVQTLDSNKTTANLLLKNTSPNLTIGSAVDNIAGNVHVIQPFHDGAVGSGFAYIQAHDIDDAVNFNFMRSRGTVLAPTGLQGNDRIAELAFYGRGSNDNWSLSGLMGVLAYSPTTPEISARIVFALNNGTDATPVNCFRIEPGAKVFASEYSSVFLNADITLTTNGTGTVRIAKNFIPSTTNTVDLGTSSVKFKDAWLQGTVNIGSASITASGSAIALPAGSTVGGVLIGSIVIKGTVANQAALPGGATTGDSYVALSPTPTHLWTWNGSAWVDLGEFQGPAGADGADGVGIPTGGTTGQVLSKVDGTNYNTQWVTPSLVGALDDLSDVTITGTPTNGQVLKYDSGTGQWVNAADETSTVFTRGTVSGTSGSLTDGQAGPINITGFKSYALLKIQTDKAAWVRIYTSEAARLADASRLEGTDPAPGAGIIAEVITTGAETVIISPGVVGFNDETVPTTNVPCRVTNKSGTTGTVTVTLSLIKLEV